MLSPFWLPSWLFGLPFGVGLRFALFAGLVQGAGKLGWPIKIRKLARNAAAQIAGFLSMSRPNPTLKFAPSGRWGAPSARPLATR